MPRKAAAAVAETVEPTVSRRRLGDHGHLQEDVKTVINAVLTGELVIEGDKTALTPHRVAGLVQEWRIASGDAEAEAPSTGAVSAVFKRWNEYGYALFTEKPMAFKKFTAAGVKLGLSGLMEKRKAERAAERAALKAAENGETAPVKKAAPRKRAAKKAAAVAS